MNYTHDMVNRKLNQMFKGNDRVVAQQILEQVSETHEQGRARIQLALLKISQNNLEKLCSDSDYLKIDWRDVIASAEYPNQLQSGSWNLSEEENQELINKDLEQYLAWIDEE